ncbi:hypothetical protein GCM10022289_10290 [Pedobacter jeongneungensis]|uniref:Uncharacterized protein n=1 Tax=Pedobacter jeongneungensis TaxID=947309 RepID=A0ABP8B6Y9_9SPHI
MVSVLALIALTGKTGGGGAAADCSGDDLQLIKIIDKREIVNNDLIPLNHLTVLSNGYKRCRDFI